MKLRSKIVFIKSLIVFMALSLTGCEDVIHVDLETGEDRLVVDAEIFWQKGTDGSRQKITLSRMAAYYNPSIPKVSGAEVYVNNSAGDSFVFTESEEAGVYVCTNFIPVLNDTYTLHIRVEDEEYTASETLMPVPAIDRIQQTTVTQFETEVIELSLYVKDPADETNYYLSGYETGILQYPEYELMEDDFYNGNEIRSDFSDEDLKPGHTVDITLRGLSKQFYNYMNLILDAADPDMFSTPPASIRGNVVNQTTPGKFALGYFRLCELDRINYVVE